MPVLAVLTALLSLLVTPVFAGDSEFAIIGRSTEAERTHPQACFDFDDEITRGQATDIEDYVRVTPEIPLAVTVRASRLCLVGFTHGNSYKVTIRQGLRSAGGRVLAEDVNARIVIRDRDPSVTFRGSGHVLPSSLAKGLPVHTVNVEALEVSIVRINERNIVQQVLRGQQGRLISSYGERRLAEQEGERVWQGTLEVEGEHNRETATLIPVHEILDPLSPGLYVVTARDSAVEEAKWRGLATQWFVVSDIGLTSYQADDGLTVQARSLETAMPLAGVELILLAHNNDLLGEAVTDAEGLARFPAGLIRGTGGNRPGLLYATRDGGDFVHLDLSREGIELHELGGAGRPAPGAFDGFAFTERGIYRPGETVEATALLRDGSADAVTGVPLTVIAFRPDGREYRRTTVNDVLGGYHVSLALPDNAPGGEWALRAHVDPEDPPIAWTTFSVADFVPPQVEVDVGVPAGRARRGAPIAVEIDAKYFYGAPASDLPGKVRLTLTSSEAPAEGLEGYTFGLVQEPFLPTRLPAEEFATDATGRATQTVSLDELPDTTFPLSARIDAVVYELSGRPVSKSVAVPLASGDLFIGIKPLSGDSYVPRGSHVEFDVITVDGDGTPVAARGLRYELVSENVDYSWYRRDGRWYVEKNVFDQPVTGGSLQVAARKPSRIGLPVDWGRYRLDVFDPSSGAASSVRFRSGYWVDPSAGDRADTVEITLDRQAYAAGDLARVFIKPPYDAKVVVAVAGRTIEKFVSRDVTAAGGLVEIPVSRDWIAGAHLLVNAYATARETAGPLPRRAVGVRWLPLDPAGRSLDVAVEAPDQTLPSSAIDVAVRLSNLASGEEAYVTLAAVDEGILRLTGYASPDPIAHYLGRRALAVAQRDLYGRLIDPTGERVGVIRSGGDDPFALQDQALPERSTETVSLYSGIVAVDDRGTATIPLELPDFNGQLRLMAVAWSGGGTGKAVSRMVVRAPVIAAMTLPRFLAPDDEASSVIVLRNLDGAPGEYRVELAVDGPVDIAEPTIEVAALEAGEERRVRRVLRAMGVGVAEITMTVHGPDGSATERARKISVRPASPFVTERLTASLAPGRSLELGPDITTGFRPETVSAVLSIGTLPQLDVEGLLLALDRYPYGCVEQITSRALPLLYVNSLSRGLGLREDRDLSKRIDGAISRLAAYQAHNGGFSLWGGGSGRAWLTAYVTEFLLRAADAGFDVPEQVLSSALAWLENYALNRDVMRSALVSKAYAHYVLALGGVDSLSELRYFADRYETRLTEIGRAHLAAAFSMHGDPVRARTTYAGIPATHPGLQLVSGSDFGSPLRDLAAVVTLGAEGGIVPHDDLVPALARLSATMQQKRYLSTQDMAWLVRAAHAVSRGSEGASVEMDGKVVALEGGSHRASLDTGATAIVRNLADRELHHVVSVTGIPTAPLPAETNGMVLSRKFFNLEGQPIDPGSVRQGDRFIVWLEGRNRTRRLRQALVTQLLPAGWEIEPASRNAIETMLGLKRYRKLTSTERVEHRDDRFVAAVNLDGTVRFRLAFMVRAVTPGTFVMPGGLVEDMYDPGVFARHGARQVTVLPR